MKELLIAFGKGLLSTTCILAVVLCAFSWSNEFPLWACITIAAILILVMATNFNYIHRHKVVVHEQKVITEPLTFKSVMRFMSDAYAPKDILEGLEKIDKCSIKDFIELSGPCQVMKSEEQALRERLRSMATSMLDMEHDKEHARELFLMGIQFSSMCIYHNTLINRMDEAGMIDGLGESEEIMVKED